MALASRFRCFARPSFTLARAGYRIAKTDPHALTDGDVGYFYSIDQADFDAYLHGFFSRQHRDLMKTFDDRSLMVRAPALEVTECLAKLDLSRPLARFLFYGARGAGLSCQQAQVAHWCARHGWLLVHAVGLERCLRYTPDLTKSLVRPGRWDTPSTSVSWLKYFSEMNKGWLQEHRPKITTEVVWNLNESNQPDTPWETIIQFGIARPKYATDCIGVILREVRKQATSSVGTTDGGMRALVCVDGINVLWSDGTRLRDGDAKPVTSRDLALHHFFRRLAQNDWCNAALVSSVSQKANWSNQRESHLPQYLLGTDGWRALEPFVPVQVDRFSLFEGRQFIEYLLDMGWITNEAVQKEMGKLELLTLSDRNAKELLKVTSEW